MESEFLHTNHRDQQHKAGWVSKLLSNKPHTFILLFLLVLSSISFYTTYDGLIRFSYGSFSQTPGIFIVVLFLFVTVLQGMLLFSLYEMLHSAVLLKLLWLFVYLVTMGVSVFFSYSFYYNLFRADSYAFDNFSSQLNEIKKSALDYQDSFLQIRNDTEKLANYSRRRAEEERQRGGTCGYMSPPNSGPRSRYRDKEARIFTALSADISDLYDNVSTNIRSLENLLKTYVEEKTPTDEVQNKMNKIVQTLNHYKTSGKISNLKSTLRDHMYDRRKTDGKDSLGFAIACPDENIDIKGTTIVKQIASLPTVREVVLFNPDSDREVLSRALTVFMQIPKAILPQTFLDKLFTRKTQAEAEATKITPLDYAPLLLGGLIDLFIFIVGLADGLENRRRHWGLNTFDGRYVSTNDIPNMGQIANQDLFLNDLRSHIYRNRWSYSLVIPAANDHLDETTHGILDLVEAMEAAHLLSRPKQYDVSYAQFPESLKRSLDALYNNASERTYHRYKLPASLWRELQQAYYSWHIFHDN